MSTNDEAVWLGRLEAAKALNISPECFDRSVKTAVPEDAIQIAKHGARLYRLDALITADVERRTKAATRPRRESTRSSKPMSEDDALILTDANSDSLEEWRKWKARLAKLEYERRSEEAVPVGEVAEAWTAATTGLQSLVERWERRGRQGDATEVRHAIRLGVAALSSILRHEAKLERRSRGSKIKGLPK